MLVLAECNLAAIVSALLNGKTIVFPTETSYGLGCDAVNQQAVDNVFKIKGRQTDKSLLAAVPSIAMAKQYLEWNEAVEELAGKYWPGPLTVIGRYAGSRGKYKSSSKSETVNRKLAAGVVSADNTVAIRVTAHPLLKSITEKLGRPLVATSANLAGAGDAYDAAEISASFRDKNFQPDILLDYGRLPERPPTTIVSVVGGVTKVIRQGDVKILSL